MKAKQEAERKKAAAAKAAAQKLAQKNKVGDGGAPFQSTLSSTPSLSSSRHTPLNPHVARAAKKREKTDEENRSRRRALKHRERISFLIHGGFVHSFVDLRNSESFS